MFKNWIGAAALLAAGAFVLYRADEMPPETEVQTQSLLQADIHILTPKSRQVTVSTYGKLRPRWHSRLSAEVGGRVVMVSERLLTGARFQQGDLLAQIEDSSYRSAAAAARSELATAERTLLEEEQRGKLALENWRASGLGGAASALTLRQPQLVEARAAVEASRTSVQQAEYELEQTRITAPFDGVVANRSLNPGEVVQVGSQIAEVFDSSVFEVTASLSVRQFAQLGASVGAEAILTSAAGEVWQGEVVRVDPSVDSKNRWIKLLVQLAPGTPAMPGQFLTIQLQGRWYDALYAVPDALITRQGSMWYLDANDQLQMFTADPVFSEDGVSYFVAEEGLPQPLRLAVPRSAYLKGVKAQANVVSGPAPDAGQVAGKHMDRVAEGVFQ